MSEKENEYSGVTNFLAFIVLAVICAPFRAFVAMKGWDWLVAPIFGITFTFWQWFGMLAVWSFLTASLSTTELDKRPLAEKVISSFLFSVVSLGLLWIYKQIVGY